MDITISAAYATSVAQLFNKAIQEHPPCLQATLPADRWMMPLGAYLVSLGYLSQHTLELVLAEQLEARQQGINQPLGTLLVQKNLVPAQVVAAVILVQMVDRLMFHTISTPAPEEVSS
jgi:hypothetical protein